MDTLVSNVFIYIRVRFCGYEVPNTARRDVMYCKLRRSFSSDAKVRSMPMLR